MAKPTTSERINKLKSLHRKGAVIAQQIKRKPSNIRKCEKGEFERVGKEHGMGAEMARKLVKFSERYTSDEIQKLVDRCTRANNAIGFDVIIPLLSIKNKRLRSKLQNQAIDNGWSKTRLRQEMRVEKATESIRENAGQLVDKNRRGKLPIATTDPTALLGELLDDAKKWHRIADLLAPPDGPIPKR